MEPGFSAPTTREIAETLQDGQERSRLCAYALSRFGIESWDAEDLLQETALELVRQRTTVRSPRGFVFRVFHTKCCRFLEKRRAEFRIFTGTGPSADSGREESQDESASQRVALREVFRTISSSCRKILLAYYVEGRSLRETARTVPLPYSGVWSTISRCLRRLRSCLE